jgi:hypothetical protein
MIAGKHLPAYPKLGCHVVVIRRKLDSRRSITLCQPFGALVRLERWWRRTVGLLDQQGETVDKSVPQVIGLGLRLVLFVWQAAIATDERKLSFLAG